VARRYGQGSLYRVTGRKQSDVLAKMRVIQGDKDNGLPAGASVTVAQWLTNWGETIVPLQVSADTAKDYRRVVKDYIVPHIGTIRLRALEPKHVEAMMAALAARGLAPGTVRKARKILRRALGEAEKRGDVSRNAAALAAGSKTAPVKLDDSMDADDANTILRAASDDRLGAMASLILGVGVRRGEVIALRWSDIDIDAATLTVRKAKTDAGVRTIAIPAFALAALKAHRRRQREERVAAKRWTDSGMVFTRIDGRPLSGSVAYHWWAALCTKAGVPRCRFHATRHTAATLMLNDGVPLEVVSATLGHAGIAITADVYAKVRPKLQKQAADAMDRVLGGR
jgi:integrase